MPVAVPTLAVLDLANGSQATATISGATAGTTNTVYAQAVEGTGSGSWVSVGSRVGDGQVTVAPGQGYWWFHVISTDGSESTLSNIVYRSLTSGEDAVLVQSWDAIIARFQQLELSGIPRHRIYKQHQLQLLDSMEFPCVVVCLEDGTEQEAAGTNETDDIGYPFKVVILDREDDYEAWFAKRMLWRQQLMRAVRHQKLTGVTLVHTVRVTPLVILGEKPEDADIFWSAFEARPEAREPRGLT